MDQITKFGGHNGTMGRPNEVTYKPERRLRLITLLFVLVISLFVD